MTPEQNALQVRLTAEHAPATETERILVHALATGRDFHKSLSALLKLQNHHRLNVPLGRARRCPLEDLPELAADFKTELELDLFGAQFHLKPVPLKRIFTRYLKKMASIGIAVTVTWDDTLPNGHIEVDDATGATLHLRSPRHLRPPSRYTPS